MHLSPLQSRLAASMMACCLLYLLYLFLFSPHFALAADLGPGTPAIILDDEAAVAGGAESAGSLHKGEMQYEPEFAAFDKSLTGRAAPGAKPLVDDIPVPMNVVAGSTEYFVFEKSIIFATSPNSAHLELRSESSGSRDKENLEGEPRVERRDTTTKTVYITANTCLQPQPNPDTTASSLAPQLTLYVSMSTDNTSPGPNGDPEKQTSQAFTEGAVMFETSVSDTVYIGISAPNITKDAFTGSTYNFNVAVSTSWWYFSYNDQVNSDLVWVDSDSSAALLMTHNLTNSSDPRIDEEMMKTQPYVMFAQNQADTSIDGVRYSYCGLQNYAQIAATRNGKYADMVSTDMTRIGPGNEPKQQFYFSGLNASTNYLGILALKSNSSDSSNGVVGGGGHVSRATSFSTKTAGGNCDVIFNLTFCNQTAYAVPSNHKNFANASALAAFYDDYARHMWGNFEKVLAQIQCEASPTQRYSLVRNCTDCAEAYKAWLCSVTIPRCEDFSNNEPWLQPRDIMQPFANGARLPKNVTDQFPNILAYNSSRNPLIDQNIQPGPYKEVLPCENLCYDLVQSCPAEIGFSCPMPGQYGFNTSYGRRTAADQNGSVTCNYPGSAHYFSAASVLRASWAMMTSVGAVGALLLVL